MTTPGDEEVRRPTNKNKKVGLNEGQFQWRVVTRRVICGQKSILESVSGGLDYDLRGWEPVEYEYLKVYPAVNSELKISEYTEDRNLIRYPEFGP
ncbi:hypothetical protein BY996DRAFT_8393636 [Phakopsora pachyrhizi]|nr:hypothetical protein BY996DRAFT_8393636 [Phakopsora pachyrhizi]